MDGAHQEGAGAPAMAEEMMQPGAEDSAPAEHAASADFTTSAGAGDVTTSAITSSTAVTTSSSTSHVQEISQQNIKNRLNEVITEIEREVEQELAGDEPGELGEEEHTQHAGAQENSARTVATPPTTPEPEHQSAHATEGQGQPDSQWPVENGGIDQSVSSGVVSEQNGSQSEASAQHVTSGTASSFAQTPVGRPTTSAQGAQTEPIAYQAHEGRYSSPYSSRTTSSLPRGWSSGGGVAFALSGRPHEAPEQRQAPATSNYEPWKAHEASAPSYATLPRTTNPQPRGWAPSAPATHGRGEHQKRVHFADAPQVETFDDDDNVDVPIPAPAVTMRPRPEGGRNPRPVSAPAAAQLFTIPNMAARPYGRTSPLVVAPVRREESPLPTLGGGHVEVDACVREDQRDNPEMSSQLSEPEPEPEPEPPTAPPAPPAPKAHLPPSKIFTPAHDEMVIPQKKKTMFVDSAFFSPKVHPTWEQQVEMAKRISSSLSDASNKQSKGQSMYERRKKRSVKWVHDAEVKSTSETIESLETTGGSQSEAEDGSESPHVPKDKPLLQLLMNPHGHVMDMNALRKQGWIIDSKGGLSPEVCSDIIKDLNSPTGKGAQIFAKRKKRAEKWIVDEEHREMRKTDESQVDAAAQQKQKVPPTPQPAPQPPKPAPAAPRPTQPAPAFQQPPVQLQPVPLQSLYQAPVAPQFPSGGVYAPRTPHSWTAVQGQTAPPVPEVTMRRSPAAAPAVSGAGIDQMDSNQVSARAAMLAEQRQRNRQSWNNYNTAARGWGNQEHFYRPVTFTQPLLSQ